MPIDLEAIRKRSKDINDCHDVHCQEDTVALLAEVERLQFALIDLRSADRATLFELGRYQMKYVLLAQKMDQQPPPRWISVEERWPEPKTWFVGLIISDETNFETKVSERVVRQIRGYPKPDHPRELFPEMTHWMPLPEPPITREEQLRP